MPILLSTSDRDMACVFFFSLFSLPCAPILFFCACMHLHWQLAERSHCCAYTAVPAITTTAAAGIASPAHLITVVGYGGVTPPLEKIPRPLRGFLRSCLQQEPSRRPTFAACAQLLQQLHTANLLDVVVDLNSLLGLSS